MKTHKQNTIVTTSDGSHTLYSEKFGEHYHSTFGAIQESAHIFIGGALNGFQHTKSSISILEIGFGTGLNALLSLIWADKNLRCIQYHGLEAFPISIETAETLNYHKTLHIDHDIFLKLHALSDKPNRLSKYFTIHHKIQTLEDASFPINYYDVIYFDAFSPDIQPELWTYKVFHKLFTSLKNEGILTTYSCKGVVKRAMEKAGFKIEKMPGPPGKREFLKAFKS